MKIIILSGDLSGFTKDNVMKLSEYTLDEKMNKDKYISSVKGIFSDDLDYVCLESIKHKNLGDQFKVQLVAKISIFNHERNISDFEEMKFIKTGENSYEQV